MVRWQRISFAVALATGCLAASGCARNEFAVPDPDPNAPLVFLRTVGTGISTRAEFRLRNMTEEPISFRSGVYSVETWKDGQWQSGGLLCPTGAPRQTLDPGEATTFQVPWGDDPKAPPRRVGVNVLREERKQSEMIWSGGVPALKE